MCRGMMARRLSAKDGAGPSHSYGVLSLLALVGPGRSRHGAASTEQEGFEPPGPFDPTVFKTVALSHSATAPRGPQT